MIRGHTISASERNGLITTKPYRWRGTPGWNPAAGAQEAAGADLTRRCPQCHAQPGQLCHTSGGTEFAAREPSHSARRRAS